MTTWTMHTNELLVVWASNMRLCVLAQLTYSPILVGYMEARSLDQPKKTSRWFYPMMVQTKMYLQVLEWWSTDSNPKPNLTQLGLQMW
jgi:hypothetical protein